MLIKITRVVNWLAENRYLKKDLKDLSLDDFDPEVDSVYECRTKEVDFKGWAPTKDWIYLNSKCYIVVSTGTSGDFTKGYNSRYIQKLESINNKNEARKV